jgi:hypothetical protein
MKTILFAATALLVSATAGAAQATTEDGPFVYDELVFSADHRPVDGAFYQIVFTGTPEGTYRVTWHSEYYDRLAGRVVVEDRELADGITCTIQRHSVRCVDDQRPTDGALREVELVRDELFGEGLRGTFRTTYYDRRKGREIREELLLGHGLELTRSVP